MGSERLSGKVMKLLDGDNPSLIYTINQIRNVKNIDRIIVATTKDREDDVIDDFLQKNNILVFRGSNDDVLERYYECARYYNIKKILRITADCPLIDPSIIEKMIEIFENGNYDYLNNNFPQTFPDGMDVEIFTFKALKNAKNQAILPSEREHVTAFFRNNQKKFRIGNFSYGEDLSRFRLTLDYQEDLELIRLIVNKITQRPILMKDILSLFAKEQELYNINKKYKTNEGYELSLKKDKEFLKQKTFFNK